jgi:hypothetical protein
MDLHDLLSAALKDLPEMPDQIPAAARIARRRRTAARAGAVAVCTAFAIGAGTLAVAAPWHHGRSSAPPAASSTAAASSTPTAAPTPAAAPTATGPVSLADYPAHVVSVLQALLPAGDKVAWTGARDRDASRYESYQVTVGSKVYPISLSPSAFSSAMVNSGHMNECRPTRYRWATCSATTLPDGTVDMVIREPETTGTKTDTLASVYLWRGDNVFILNLIGGLGDDFSNAQLLALAQAPAYQQLSAETLNDGLFGNQ